MAEPLKTYEEVFAKFEAQGMSRSEIMEVVATMVEEGEQLPTSPLEPTLYELSLKLDELLFRLESIESRLPDTS